MSHYKGQCIDYYAAGRMMIMCRFWSCVVGYYCGNGKERERKHEASRVHVKLKCWPGLVTDDKHMLTHHYPVLFQVAWLTGTD